MIKKIILFGVLMVFSLGQSAWADVSDPVADMQSVRGLTTGDVLYKMVLDVNGDGRNDVLLCYKDDYDDSISNNEAPEWDIYLATGTNTYTHLMGIDLGQGTSQGPAAPNLSLSQMFVGQITQLNEPGIVTIQTDYPTTLPAVTYIYAYTVEGGHLKQTLLAQYVPGTANAIYDQYLSSTTRTQVSYQQITLP
jgi:hypothetical protein